MIFSAIKDSLSTVPVYLLESVSQAGGEKRQHFKHCHSHVPRASFIKPVTPGGTQHVRLKVSVQVLRRLSLTPQPAGSPAPPPSAERRGRSGWSGGSHPRWTEPRVRLQGRRRQTASPTHTHSVRRLHRLHLSRLFLRLSLHTNTKSLPCIFIQRKCQIQKMHLKECTA